MLRTAALVYLAAASLVVLATSFGIVGGVPFALVAGLFPVALIVVGAVRETPSAHPNRGRRTFLWTLALLATILEGTLVALLLLRGRVDERSVSLSGLPLPAEIQLLGIFALPLFIVGLGYAGCFDRLTLSADDLESLRRRFGRRPS